MTRHPARGALGAAAGRRWWACVLAALLCSPARPGDAQDRPSRDAVVASATAAIAAGLPQGRTARFRDLGAWEQRPGEVSVCGEISLDAAGEAAPEWRAFLAVRRTGGWGYRPNPTATTRAEETACNVEKHRLLYPPDGSAPSREAMGAAAPGLERRCPMAADILWTDHAMACAGHDYR